jgi:hypothetical protein
MPWNRIENTKDVGPWCMSELCENSVIVRADPISADETPSLPQRPGLFFGLLLASPILHFYLLSVLVLLCYSAVTL